MTGYGKAKAELNDKSVDIEIKTLNSKNLDINFRTPTILKANEQNWRKLVSNKLKRGKVDILINFKSNDNQKNIKINKSLVQSYVADMQDILSLRDELDNAKLLEIAMNLPDVINSEDNEISDKDKAHLFEAIHKALEQVVDFRKQEGQNLLEEFIKNLDKIRENLETIQSIDSNRIERVRNRLMTSISELKIDHDENRFEQELIYYIEKYDISEEKSRLLSHLKYFDETLNSKESNGKKLNFISQEMGREINTIGSKANDAEMQNLVVEMKDQLEKIKEQLLNIL